MEFWDPAAIIYLHHCHSEKETVFRLGTEKPRDLDQLESGMAWGPSILLLMSLPVPNQMLKPHGYSISTCPLAMGLTEAYSRPLLFMARYRPEKSPLIATTPTSTAVISRMPGKSQEGSITCPT